MMRIGKCCGAMLLMDKLSGQCEKILTMQPRAEMGTELLKRAYIVAKMCQYSITIFNNKIVKQIIVKSLCNSQSNHIKSTLFMVESINFSFSSQFSASSRQGQSMPALHFLFYFLPFFLLVLYFSFGLFEQVSWRSMTSDRAIKWMVWIKRR